MDGALARCTAIVEAHRRQGPAIRRRQPARRVRRRRGARGRRRTRGALPAWRCWPRAAGSARRCCASTATPASTCASACTPAACCSAAASTPKAASAASPSTSPRAWSRRAPAGALRISHDTYRHVRGVFDVEPQPPIEVKGVDAAVAHLPRAARQAARVPHVGPRGIEGVETRMVGRDAELAQLQRALDEALHAARSSRVITVVAEAGVGKSRLLLRVRAPAANAARSLLRCFHGRAHAADSRSQPYGLLRDLLAWRLQIARRRHAAGRAQQARAGVAAAVRPTTAPTGTGHAHLLGHLIGLDFAASPHVAASWTTAGRSAHRAFHAAPQYLRRSGRRTRTPASSCCCSTTCTGPTTARWTSSTTCRGHAAIVPLLLLCLTRPALFERRPRLGRRAGPCACASTCTAGEPRASAQLADDAAAALSRGARRRCAT